MSTKGECRKYGNTKGSGHRGEPTEKIKYPYAKAFNKQRLKEHFNKHKTNIDCSSEEEYEARALHFANAIDPEHCDSVVDKNNNTYKYNAETGEVAKVTNKGIIITYYICEKGFSYINKRGERKWEKR